MSPTSRYAAIALVAVGSVFSLSSLVHASYIPPQPDFAPTISIGGGAAIALPTTGWSWHADASNPDDPTLNYWVASAPTASLVGGSLISYTEQYNADPTVGLSYSIENLTGTVQTYTFTRTLLTPALAAPNKYRGSVGISLSDGDSVGDTDGTATLTSTAWAAVYTAKIDGVTILEMLPPTGSSSIYSLTEVGDGETVNDSAATPTAAGTYVLGGPAVNNSINITLTFTLSPGDNVAISSNFVVIPQVGATVPEPASLGLLGLGAAALLAKRRR